jgi:hypothetical protein
MPHTPEHTNDKQQISGEDTELVVRMVIKMLSEGEGLQVIDTAVRESQDPALVVGQFLAQMMAALMEQLSGELGVDPRVVLAEGGALETILDYIESQLGYPEEFSDEIYVQVLETIKAAAQQPPAGNQVGAQMPMGGSLDGSR